MQKLSLTDFIVKKDRKLIVSGPLMAETKSNLWNSLWSNQYQKRHVILLSDLLIVTTPVPNSSYISVDHIIDLFTLKVKV
jgi:hypothetical protein